MSEAWQAKECAVIAPLLSALLDGELLLPQRRRVEQHLRTCSTCPRSLEEARFAREALRTLGRDVTAPPVLAHRVQAGMGRSHRATRLRLPFVAAGVAALFALLALLSVVRIEDSRQTPALVTRAVAAHRMAEADTTPLALSTSDPEQAATWISGLTGRKLDAPSFDAAGYRLLGVRLATQVAPDGVEMVYAGPNRLLTCVVVPGESSGGVAGMAGRVQLSQFQGTTVARWQDGQASYLLVGDVAPEELLRVARLAAQQDRSPE